MSSALPHMNCLRVRPSVTPSPIARANTHNHTHTHTHTHTTHTHTHTYVSIAHVFVSFGNVNTSGRATCPPRAHRHEPIARRGAAHARARTVVP